jgi:hypothetical protein
MQLGNQPGRVVRRVSRGYAPASQRLQANKIVGFSAYGGVHALPAPQTDQVRVAGGQTRRPDVTDGVGRSRCAAASASCSPRWIPIYLPREVDYPSE